jgi:two-component system alkaline phosphatase synthesis response regulator PhoP
MEEYSFDGNHINFTTYEATGPKGKFKLTKKEVMLIRLFLERKNQVVSRKDILQAVWGYDVIPSTRTIDNFILMLRKNFEKTPSAPTHFISVRGVGYKFVE